MDVVHASVYGITVVDSTDDKGVHKGDDGVSRQYSSDGTQLPQTVKAATSEPSDVISECQFLVYGNTEAGDCTKKIDSGAVDKKVRAVDFGELIPRAETGELRLLGVQFQPV